MLAVNAAEAQESVCEHAAFEEGLEFLRHMLWKMFALFTTQVLEAPQAFLNDFVEESGFGAAANVAGIVPRKGRLPVPVMMGSV